MPFVKGSPGRQPDKPGTYRIRDGKDGRKKLSGVRADGTRFRMGGLSAVEAQDLADRMFPSGGNAFGVRVDFSKPEETKTDDWGFPIRVSEDTVVSVAQTLNIPKLPDAAAISKIIDKPPEPTREEIEKKERRAKNARSLMDLAGIAGAAGDVMLARKLCERVGKEPVKPDTKQVNDLRDSIKETLTELFGDSEISPWKMMILLAIGIPLSMLIQSPKKKEPDPEKKPDLKAV